MIVKFKGYGRGEDKYVNVERIVCFERISFNGDYGSELFFADGSSVRVGHWPEDVAKMIESKKATTNG